MNYSRFWYESCRRNLLLSCLQELPRILTWFLSRILSRDLVSILLSWITQDSDMILVKGPCKYLACKNYPRYWHDSSQGSCQRTLLVSCFQEFPKFLAWVLSRTMPDLIFPRYLAIYWQTLPRPCQVFLIACIPATFAFYHPPHFLCL